MGLVSGFMKGSGDAAAFIGKTYLMDNIQKDRDEVNALRDANLKTSEREAGQEFTTSEREEGEKFKAAESEKERASKEKQVKTAADAKGYKGADPYKYSFSLGGQPMKYSDVVKAYKEDMDLAADQIDVESPGFHKWAKEQGYKINTGTGKGVDIPIAKKPAEAGEPSTDDIMKAREWYSDKAEILRSDKSQFGMSEKEVVDKKAKELMVERVGKGGKKSGIIGSEVAKPAAAAKSYGVPTGHVSYMKKNKDDPKVKKAFMIKYKNLTEDQYNELIGK